MIASNEMFIVTAYAVAWLVFIGYLLRLVRAGRRARTGLEQARGALAKEARP